VLKHKAKAQQLLTTIQIDTSVQAEHVNAELSKPCQKHKNHDNEHTDALLSVPCYADLLEDSGPEDSLPDQDDPGSSNSTRSVLVAS